MLIRQASHSVGAACEQVLRSLPAWFGIDDALLDYAAATDRLPTYLAIDGQEIVAFLTLETLSATETEIHCMAVHKDHRGRGIGSALMAHVER